MDWKEVETSWSNVRERVHTRWSKLTDADLSAIKGRRETLIARLEQRYGMDKTKATREAENFIKTLH